MNIINKVTNKVSNFVNEKKKEWELYNQTIDNSLLFTLDKTIQNNNSVNEGNITEYKDMCPYINDNQANNISNLIPLNEIVFYIVQVEQKKDNQVLIIILTNLRIIIMKDNLYTELGYSDIKVLQLVNKSFMTQVINFNGIILGIDLNQNDLNVFYNLITNMEYRNAYISEKIQYLCGIIPVYQRLNIINSGISIDNNKNIVFHNKKVNNYLCRYDDILNYELLEDNTPVIKRRTNDDNTSMPFSKKECMQIKLRVTMINNQVFEINILEPSTFNNTYNHMNSTYIKNYNFGKEIMDKLDSLNEKLYKKKD